jgi:DNA repair exonuclease SbcCD ATPase subunit
MSTTNYPSASPQGTTPKKDFKGAIIGLLAVGLLGTWGYLLYDKNQSEQTIQQQQAQIGKVTDEKSELQKSFDASLSRLDSVTGYNNQLEGQLATRNTEISKLKGDIRSILNKKNASQAELNKAKQLIGQLNEKVAGLEQEVARLTQENQTLTTDLNSEKEKTTKLSSDLQTTTTAKQELEQKVDVGSTLNATNFNIAAINEKNGGKEVSTSSAKRADKFRISFDVENRLAVTGPKELYVLVTTPEGKVITEPNLGSGTFSTREDGEKTFTNKVNVDYEQGQRKNVSFDLKQAEKYKPGNYGVEIYQNGFKIGSGKVTLKKGGLFG